MPLQEKYIVNANHTSLVVSIWKLSSNTCGLSGDCVDNNLIFKGKIW
jgi:hypothetical protein